MEAITYGHGSGLPLKCRVQSNGFLSQWPPHSLGLQHQWGQQYWSGTKGEVAKIKVAAVFLIVSFQLTSPTLKFVNILFANRPQPLDLGWTCNST